MAEHWLITGVSSGFGREITEQVLRRGDHVVGTVRRLDAAQDLQERYPDTFCVEQLDLTDTASIRPVVDAAASWLGRLDVVVNNAGYGLFGAAEELTDEQVEHQLDTNLLGSIQVARAALPHLRRAGGGRIIQLSSVAGQTAYPCASLYQASKWGVEGFTEALAGEVADFGIGVTIVEPGGARTRFAAGSMQWARRLPDYDDTPVARVRDALQGASAVQPGDPQLIAAAIIATVDQDPAPLRLVLGASAWSGIANALQDRLTAVKAQEESARTTDFARPTAV